MKTSRQFALAVVALLAAASTEAAPRAKAFQWSTNSDEAKRLLGELQQRIEHFQFGPQNTEIAKKIVAADAKFAMGHYYLAATTPPPGNFEHYQKARELGAGASDGERRFIETMQVAFTNQGADIQKAIPGLEALAKDYPDERLVFVILGQVQNAVPDAAKARAAFERAQAIGPRSPRVESFLANDELLKGHYGKAREIFASIEKQLRQGSVPFPIRFGTTFSHLYEGNVDAAIASLQTYLNEYRGSGANQQFPEVFIWNAIARVNLENGRAEAAMKAYEKGFESVPGSSLPEDQKQTWLGRLRHGQARALAKLGKHEEAWKQAEEVRQMIEKGGDPAKQFWPAYHYLAGYLKLEAGDFKKAAEHIEQANLQDPFHKLLLARAYEKLGKNAEAKKAYQEIVASQWPGIERPLAYPEAKRKSRSL
jgi:tetratricopeptide (TPR) repeat protein